MLVTVGLGGVVTEGGHLGAVVLAPDDFDVTPALIGGLNPRSPKGSNLQLTRAVERNGAADDPLLKTEVGELIGPLVVGHGHDVGTTVTTVAVSGLGGNVGVKGVGHRSRLRHNASRVNTQLFTP